MEKHKELLLRLLQHHFIFDKDTDELDGKKKINIILIGVNNVNKIR